MVVFMIDADNLSACSWVEEAFQKLEPEEGSIAVRRAYGSADNLKGLAEVLRGRAIRPFVNLAMQKNTTDMALAVDAMELACQSPRPKTVVIGSGDADFLPLVVRLRERGIRMVCVSERGKLSPEAEAAYDAVLLVGAAVHAAAPRSTALRARAPRAAAASEAATRPASRKTVAKKPAMSDAPTRKVAARKSAAKPSQSPTVEITVADILRAAPSLLSGELQLLGDVAKPLHDAQLLGKNATTTRMFNKFPDDFELSPPTRPNRVRYLRAA